MYDEQDYLEDYDFLPLWYMWDDLVEQARMYPDEVNPEDEILPLLLF